MGPVKSSSTLAKAIVAVNVAVWAAAWIADRGALRGPALSVLVAFTVAFGVVSSLQIRLYFAEHRASFTLTDAVLVVGFFYLGPVWLGLAAGLGEAARCLLTRRSLLKGVFNATSNATTATLAAAVFGLMVRPGDPVLSAWWPALIAAAVWSLLNVASMSAVIGKAESTGLRVTFLRSLPVAVVTTVLASPVGLLVVALFRTEHLYPLLLSPVVAGVIFNNRYAATQRDEHLRVERLYESTTRTAQLAEDYDAPAVIAEEARRLVTGTAAVCFLRSGGDEWTGRVVRPDRVAVADAGDLGSLLEAASIGPGAVGVVPRPQQYSDLAGPTDVMLVARSPEGAPAELVVAVFRDGGGRRHDQSSVGETLAAFVAHGAVIAANAGLVHELRVSLNRQMVANRRKDEFVATISHELRTPLTVMLGATQTALRLDDRLAPSERQHFMTTALEQGQRLRLLIDDLLLVAAAEQGKLKCEIVGVTTDEIERDLSVDLPEGLSRHVRIDNRASGLMVATDRFKLRQIVTNLVDNAGKYAEHSPIDVTIDSDAEKLLVTVADYGPGIPPGHRDRVFESFVQLDQSSTRRQGGTGLGLFICQKLAVSMGGELSLAETPGGGCTFTLALPRRTIGGGLHRARRATECPTFGETPPSPLLRRPDLRTGRPVSLTN